MLLLCITCSGQFVDNACSVCCVLKRERARGQVMLMLVYVSDVCLSPSCLLTMAMDLPLDHRQATSCHL